MLYFVLYHRTTLKKFPIWSFMMHIDLPKGPGILPLNDKKGSDVITLYDLFQASSPYSPESGHSNSSIGSPVSSNNITTVPTISQVTFCISKSLFISTYRYLYHSMCGHDFNKILSLICLIIRFPNLQVWLNCINVKFMCN